MFRPFSIQIDWSVVSRIVVILIDAIDALYDDLHTYFLMRELSGGTSKFMRDTTLQSIWIENGLNIVWNNCLQGKKITLVGSYW